MKYMWLWMDIVLVYTVNSFSTMNLWQGKRERRVLTLPVVAWCDRKKVLEMCVGFTCPHFGSEWMGEAAGVASVRRLVAAVCQTHCRAEPSPTAEPHSWTMTSLGRQLGKGRKCCTAVSRAKSWKICKKQPCKQRERRRRGTRAEKSSCGGPQWIRYSSSSPRTPHCGRWRYPERTFSHEELTSQQNPSRSCSPWGGAHAGTGVLLGTGFLEPVGNPHRSGLWRTVSCGERLHTEAGEKCE